MMPFVIIGNIFFLRSVSEIFSNVVILSLYLSYLVEPSFPK